MVFCQSHFIGICTHVLTLVLSQLQSALVIVICYVLVNNHINFVMWFLYILKKWASFSRNQEGNIVSQSLYLHSLHSARGFGMCVHIVFMWTPFCSTDAYWIVQIVSRLHLVSCSRIPWCIWAFSCRIKYAYFNMRNIIFFFEIDCGSRNITYNGDNMANYILNVTYIKGVTK